MIINSILRTPAVVGVLANNKRLPLLASSPTTTTELNTPQKVMILL